MSIPKRRSTAYRIAGVALLLSLLFGQMATSSRRKSAAFDETYHLVSGYAYLHTGDPRLSWEHPPVPQALAALPLIRRADLAPFPTDHPGWQEGNAEAFVDEYLWVDNAARAPDLVWAGRVPLMLLTVAFGLALFLALHTCVGEPAAWIGLTLFALDPNIIANGRLIGNDLAVAGFIFLAVWRLGIYLREPSARRLILTGVMAGLAAGSKATAALIVPIFFLLALILPGENQDARPILARFGRRLLAMMGMAGVAAITLWAIFGFEVGPLTPGGLPLPAPTYVSGLPRMMQRIARGTPTYLLGRTSDTGWWYYFGLTFLLKTPLPTLILLALGIAHAVRRPRETAIWWLPALVYLLAASASTLQIGYRYILPVLFFAIALAASPFRRWPCARWQRIGLGLLSLWLIIDAAWTYPHHLSFANEIVGGPRRSWRHFADMNVDWGMDLIALREYEATHPDEEVNLAYFGSAIPSAYGVRARLLPSFSRALSGPTYHAYNAHTPPPGAYAISATSLHLGLLYEGQDMYAYFRAREPDARVGGSILIYHVDYPPETPVDRAVVIGPAVWRLSPEALDWESGHRLIAKWSAAQSFILPAAGSAHYVVEREIPDTPAIRAALRGDDPREIVSSLPTSPPATTPDGTEVAWPARFEDGPELIGWEVASANIAPGEPIGLLTRWRVTEPLPTPPLAAFVHLMDAANAEGAPIAQWDGWPAALLGLEPGDVLIFEHTIATPATLAPGEYPLTIGLYRPPHGPRLPVAGADRLRVTTVKVGDGD